MLYLKFDNFCDNPRMQKYVKYAYTKIALSTKLNISTVGEINVTPIIVRECVLKGQSIRSINLYNSQAISRSNLLYVTPQRSGFNHSWHFGMALIEQQIHPTTKYRYSLVSSILRIPRRPSGYVHYANALSDNE